MSVRKLVECVPNFSEGRNKTVIDAIARSISGITGVKLLDVDPGTDTNRTVFTFVGDPESVVEAAVASARTAFDLIDMTLHTGAHPRMGAMDVCPFVPVSGVTMEECVEISRKAAERIAGELAVPVYLYEKAARTPRRTSLADIRAGEYEALPDKMGKPEWEPDYGPSAFIPRWGATVVGAREFLIAYNVNLNTRDRKLANDIALTIREGGRSARDVSGNVVKDESGNPVKVPGLLSEVRAIGWYIDAYRCAQVSINLIDYRTTPLHVVWETVRREADRLGLVVTGSEIVGLLPLEPLADAGRHFLKKMGKSEGGSERELIEVAVRSMGLDSVNDFDPERKIVEYAARESAPLVSMKVAGFVDEVSRDSPAPGGGSVAALAGSLGAALAAMVANLTVGKKGYEAAWPSMSELAVRSQRIKEELVRAVDEDTNAFNGLMEAMKLPKSSPEQREARDVAMQEGYKKAAAVPLETARICLEAISACLVAAEKGNANSASDAGVGALMARAGVEGAVLNVLINLGPIVDAAFKTDCAARAEAMAGEARLLCERTVGIVRSSLVR